MSGSFTRQFPLDRGDLIEVVSAQLPPALFDAPGERPFE